jgi:hypothetical protein
VGQCRIDDNKAPELRRVLDQLTELAEGTGVAVLVIAHVNKAAGSKAVYRVAGNGAYVTAVRLAYMIGPDPEDPDRHLLMPVKFNLLGLEKSAVAIRQHRLDRAEAQPLRTHDAFADLDDADFAKICEQMARVEFDDPVEADADQVMGQRAERCSPKKEDCLEWLLKYLEQYAYSSEEVFKAGGAKGFGRNMIYAVRRLHNEKPGTERIWAVNRTFRGEWWWGIGSRPDRPDRPDRAAGQLAEGSDQRPEEDAILADLRREAY